MNGRRAAIGDRVSRLEAALALHRTGALAAAIEIYRQVLDVHPRDVDALHLQGVALRDLGHHAEALPLLEQAVRLRPAFAEAKGNLGMVYAELGRGRDAIAAYRDALALNPALAEVWFNLGNAWRDQAAPAEALAAYREALARGARPEVWQNLAGVLAAQGEIAAAAQAYRQATSLAPERAASWLALGDCLYGLQDNEEAIRCYHRATCLEPANACAHNNLGNALKAYGRHKEAVLCYERALQADPGLVPAWNNLGNSLHQLGRGEDAMRCLRRALALQPAFADAHLNLGNVLKLRGQTAEALYCFRRALACKPGFAEAHNNIGVVLTEQGAHAEALLELAQALACKSDFAEAHNNLGNVYRNQGRLLEAQASFARALALRPDYAGAHSNLLFTLNFMDGVPPDEIYARHREYEARHAGAWPADDARHASDPDPSRRLRIGYVSPDFRAHACAFFLEPLLRHHDRSQVEVYAYAEVAQPDAITERLRGLTDVWRSTVGASDDEVADLIRGDRIDVLIDLAGHTANARLLALARKPAPVQIGYLGYPATTGLRAMDYRLTDAVAEPEGSSERYYTERLVRLPHSLWCYAPFDDMPEPSPSPAARNGYVTFGSFNSYSKVGPRVVALWADVLIADPTSRLEMITVPAGEAQQALRERFAALGVDPRRIALHDRLPRAAYVELFSRIDIALDPFPCNGGTTTCDALWMGLPVVSLIGDTFLSRASLSVLTAAGYPGFAARDPADYVARCVALGCDRDALARLRAGMRGGLRASPLTDGPAFARDVETAYRDLWRRWCEGRAAAG